MLPSRPEQSEITAVTWHAHTAPTVQTSEVGAAGCAAGEGVVHSPNLEIGGGGGVNDPKHRDDPLSTGQRSARPRSAGGSFRAPPPLSRAACPGPDSERHENKSESGGTGCPGRPVTQLRQAAIVTAVTRRRGSRPGRPVTSQTRDT